MIPPLVEIPDALNPYRKDGVRIYAKLMNMTPLGNVKSFPAVNMLHNLKDQKDVHTIVENSSGNTVFSLAVVGRLLGISNTKAFVSHEVSSGKLQLLRVLGIQPIINEEPICPDPEDKESGIYKAKIKGKQKGWFNPGQYDNKFNPQSHYKWTGPQIWEQTHGDIDVFCTGLGTTGTMVGIGSYLKEKNPRIKNIGVVRQPNNPVPGVRTSNLLTQIAFNWQGIVDATEEVGTVDSFKFSLELCRHGLLVGPSSGFALNGLLQYLAKAKHKNIRCVFICADSPLPYLNEYFEYLDETAFPTIENANLLINKPNDTHQRVEKTNHLDWGIAVEDAFSKIYKEPKDRIWQLVKQNNEVHSTDKIVLLDVRTPEEYLDAHAPNSINIDHITALSKIKHLSESYKEKEVYVICRSGKRSDLVTTALREEGITAYNINGGMIEWSQKNYPRWRPEICNTSLK